MPGLQQLVRFSENFANGHIVPQTPDAELLFEAFSDPNVHLRPVLDLIVSGDFGRRHLSHNLILSGTGNDIVQKIKIDLFFLAHA